MLPIRTFASLRYQPRALAIRRLFTRTMSSATQTTTSNLPNEKYIITSTHDDCFIHELTVTQRFFQQSCNWPDRIALECGITGQKHTYGELQKQIKCFGSCLIRMGFRRGEVLGVVLPNMPEFPITLLGAAGIGMPVTTVNPIYTADEISRQMQNSGACCIVTVPSMTETVRQVASEIPSVRRLIVVGDAEEGFATMKDMLNDPGDLFPENVDLNVQDDIFVLPYSSGTTGLPKGVMLTHANVGANIQQILHPGTSLLRTSGPERDTYICVLPFFHIYGMIAVLMSGLDTGAKLVTLPKFEPESYLKAMDDHHPTILHLVPPLVSFLSNSPELKLESTERLHTIFCGAAPLGETAAMKLVNKMNKTDIHFQEGYGMTELSPVSHMGSLTQKKIGSCGVLVSRTRAKVVDITTGQALGPEQDGELLVQGPQVMKGYYKNEKATRETINSEGWLHTGDIARYDEQGRFYIVDRLKELIKVKGMQVAPSELEDILRKVPGLLDVAVIGIPDEAAGELPRAYIVRKDSKEGTALTEQVIKTFIEPRVAPHKKLKGGVVFVDAIPKTNTGKILRRELKKMVLESM